MTPKSKSSNGAAGAAVIETSPKNDVNLERERVFNAFRQFGYLEGDLDPLGFLTPRPTPELQIESEYTREARAIYSSTIGVEINHIYSPNGAAGSMSAWNRKHQQKTSIGFSIS